MGRDRWETLCQRKVYGIISLRCDACKPTTTTTTSPSPPPPHMQTSKSDQYDILHVTQLLSLCSVALECKTTSQEVPADHCFMYYYTPVSHNINTTNIQPFIKLLSGRRFCCWYGTGTFYLMVSGQWIAAHPTVAKRLYLIYLVRNSIFAMDS